MEDYFPGAVLPPHLSPFVDEQEGEYVPPEKQALLNKQRGVHVDSGILTNIISCLVCFQS